MGNWVTVLNSVIPSGGRKLTSTEIKSLRRLGYTVGINWYVMPSGSKYFGHLYYPHDGGLSNTRHGLTTK